MTLPLELDIQKISEDLKIRPEIYLKLTASFAASLTGKMNKLGEAIFDNDRDQIRMILHEIKGTAGNLRLKNISEVENIMHEAVKAGENQAKIERYFEDLKAETVRTQKYINQLVPSP